MQVNATILSESNGQPVQNGLVFYTDGQGNIVPLVRANADGSFNTTVPESSPNIMVTAPGYQAQVVDVGDISDQGKVDLKPLPLAQDAILAVPNSTLSRVNPWWWAAGAAGLLYVVNSIPSQKKISGPGDSKPDYSKYILPIGILAGGYLLLTKLGIFGGTGTGANNQAVTDTVTKGTADSLAKLKQVGIVPTLSSAQAAGIANDIFYQGLQVSPGKSQGIAQIFNDLGQCKNDADIFLVMQNFGARKVASSDWSLCSLLNLNCDAIDLKTFVDSVLSASSVPGLGIGDLNYQLANDAYGNPSQVTYQF